MESLAHYARWDGAGRPFTVATTPLPWELNPGELLVAIDLATVCGSDVHTMSGRRPGPAPSVLGHEQVGTVVAAGSGARVEPGRRIIWSVTESCGQCDRCRRDLPQKCRHLRKFGHEPLDELRPLFGGFATHALIGPGSAIAVVPDSVPDEVAAPAACATATVMATVAASGSAGRALITGAGMLGLTATAVLASRGATVTVVDPDPVRAEQARRFGAAEVLTSAAGVRDIDVAIELSGAAVAVEGALASLGVGGTLVLAGSVTPGPAVGIDPERVVRKLLTVTGVHNYRPADLQAGVDFLAGAHERFPFAELVEGRHPLGRLEEAFRPGKAPRQAVKP
ncbi:zinc-binding dehydrogenase [Paractinoplanes lichenicola]|uniref:alcohol dehydrogenase n=1 Tax=Paractinoplanes lichenicola TaxID=2802976 RepID=A0ABS1W645_9ACTN|nr:zinc-binding dehydrogenase [Actinoplanes lichenicola]MBL7262207.1 zinc-binding dehydrogenase [Actinoplanes lichenicola]